MRDFILTISASSAVLLTLALVWYSPFGFGDAFLEAMEKQRERYGDPYKGMAGSFAALVACALALRALMRGAGVDSVAGGAIFGLFAGIVVAAAMLSDALWSARRMDLLTIQATFRVAYLVLMGVVLAAWE
jgi:hypothetical protein